MVVTTVGRKSVPQFWKPACGAIARIYYSASHTCFSSSSYVASAGPSKQSKPTLADYLTNLDEFWNVEEMGTKKPSDFKFRSSLPICLRCQGCERINSGGIRCGLVHDLHTTPKRLTKNHSPGDEWQCPQCRESHGGHSFCECQSVASDQRLAAEWSQANPPKQTVALGSTKKYSWTCCSCNHVWDASPLNRRTTGCPACFDRARDQRKEARRL
jgi:hypothetical protein